MSVHNYKLNTIIFKYIVCFYRWRVFEAIFSRKMQDTMRALLGTGWATVPMQTVIDENVFYRVIQLCYVYVHNATLYEEKVYI